MANGQQASAFEIIGSDPERAARFATAMSIYATKPEYSAAFLTDYYDWASLGPVQVVAVGGASHLQVLIELARRFDNVEVTVQDAPPIVSQFLDAVPAELEGRLHLAAHDLFAPQSAHGDILLLRWTLHLWSNEYCKRILRAQIPALGPNTRMIIQDSCMPEPGTVALWREQDLRFVHVPFSGPFLWTKLYVRLTLEQGKRYSHGKSFQRPGAHGSGVERLVERGRPKVFGSKGSRAQGICFGHCRSCVA